MLNYGNSFVRNRPKKSLKSITSYSDLYISAVCGLIVLFLYLDLPGYLYVITSEVYLPKYFYLALIGISLPILLLSFKDFFNYIKTPFVLWLFLMIGLNLLHLIFQVFSGNIDAAAITSTRIQYFILVICFGFAFSKNNFWNTANTYFGVFLFLNLLLILDFFKPGVVVPNETPGYVLGRASATLINANKAVESLIVLLLFAFPVVRKTLRVWVVIFAFLGVFLTFSRSGLIAWFVCVVLFYQLNLLPKSSIFVFMSALVLVLVGSSGLFDFLFSQIDSSAIGNLLGRLDFFSTLDTSDASAVERQDVANYALDSFFDSPLFGNGSGFTHLWSGAEVAPHNQHLMFLSEYGIFGYLIFLGGFYVIRPTGSYFNHFGENKIHYIVFLVFLWFSIFDHNMFDNLFWLVAFSILANRSKKPSIARFFDR